MDDTKNHTKHKERFLKESINHDDLIVQPLPSDASPRKYERITSPKGKFILMDASKDKNSVEPFIKVAEFLHQKGYSAPQIFAKEKELGLLLLEDLGEQSYASVLAGLDKETERKLYKKAIDLLLSMHNNEAIHAIDVPSYNQESLLEEAILLLDWYFPVLTGSSIAENLRQEYIQAWKKIFNSLHYAEECFVLRDYHIDNLIWMEDREGVGKVGLLDFQDAVKGSYAYDVVSLLEDARRDVDVEIANEMLEYYISQIGKLDRRKFLSDYKILGIQRSCKIIGIFTRKASRDNDSRYLKHLPRLWKYIKRNIDHPILEPLKIWFQNSDIPVMKNTAL
jgi:aminoglycoside/choline kinase family phosphotransferase